MSKIYTKLALGILGYVTLLAHPLVMCAEKSKQTYCPDAYCWFYAKDCRTHNPPVPTKTAQTAVENVPALRRCNSTTHCTLPATMSCEPGQPCVRARLRHPGSWKQLAAISLTQ